MLKEGQQVEIYYICVEQSKNAQNKTMDSDANLGSSSAGLVSFPVFRLFYVNPITYSVYEI